MKKQISDAVFEKAVDEEMEKSPFGTDEKFRFAVETIAKNLLIASEWTEASPPAIAHTAIGVLCRVVWAQFPNR